MKRGSFSVGIAWSFFAAAAVGGALLLDDAATEALSRPIRLGQLNAALFAMRFWGESVTLLAITFAAIRLQPARWKQPAAALLAALVCSAAVDLAKPLSRRSRPAETLPEPARASWANSENAGRNSSFPSGHTVTAFAFGRGIALAYPPLKPLCIALAAGTAASRIHERRHYLSDCVVGGLVGWFFTGALWRLAFRPSDRLDRLIQPAQKQAA